MKKLVISIVAILTLIPSIAFASSTGKPATLTDDMHIYYNGYSLCFTDGNGDMIQPEGSTVFPIVLDGTTYLPVRFVAGLAGLNVNWDQNTRTVELTRGGKTVTDYRGDYGFESSEQITVDMNQNITITLDGKVQSVPTPFIYNGTTYLPVRAICDMVGIPVEWRADTKTILLGTYLHEATSNSIPADAKVLTDKDMIDLWHEYKNGSFYIKSNASVNPNSQLDFTNDGYKTVTFTVVTYDIGENQSQDVCVAELDSVHDGVIGSMLGSVPQACGQTKTYFEDISGHSKIAIQVGDGNSNAVVNNIYLTK